MAGDSEYVLRRHRGWPEVLLFSSPMNFFLFVFVEPIAKLNDGYI